jgi:hypothetical protein
MDVRRRGVKSRDEVKVVASSVLELSKQELIGNYPSTYIQSRGWFPRSTTCRIRKSTLHELINSKSEFTILLRIFI